MQPPGQGARQSVRRMRSSEREGKRDGGEEEREQEIQSRRRSSASIPFLRQTTHSFARQSAIFRQVRRERFEKSVTGKRETCALLCELWKRAKREGENMKNEEEKDLRRP